MKLGDVIKKERERKKLSFEDTASRLGLSEDEYREIEAGQSPAEEWGPRLALIAIKTEKPTSRLLAESGKSADTKPGQAGPLIKKAREEWPRDPRKSERLSPENVAEYLSIPVEDYLFGFSLLTLTMLLWDPVSKEPYFKHAAVRVRRAAAMTSSGLCRSPSSSRMTCP